MENVIYLVPKVGMGNNHFMDQVYSEEILVCTTSILEKDISIETIKHCLKEKKTYLKYYEKDTIMLYLNGHIFGSKNEIQQNYLLFDNKEEAFSKMNHIIDLLQEKLLSNSKNNILSFINNLKEKVYLNEVSYIS